jgi:hypothetical protein
MTSKFFDSEITALAHLTIERAKGRKGYMLRYRAGTIEVRSWR